MLPAERDLLLRRYTEKHLARPAPLKWYAAADLYEETCDGGLTCQCRDKSHTCGLMARVWRARAKWMTPLIDLFREFCRATPQPDWRPRRYELGAAAVWMWRQWRHGGVRTHHVVVKVMGMHATIGDARWPTVGYRIWAAETGAVMMYDKAKLQPDAYYVRRAIRLIDDNRDLLDGGK